MRIVVGKAEAGTGIGEFIVRLHRVLQTAGLADNRKRPVVERYHLREAAGLKERRHQIGVGSRVNRMCHIVRIVNLRRKLVVVLPVVVAEQVLVALLSRAENHKLEIFLTKLLDDALNQIETLLVCESGHNAEHKLLVVDR